MAKNQDQTRGRGNSKILPTFKSMRNQDQAVNKYVVYEENPYSGLTSPVEHALLVECVHPCSAVLLALGELALREIWSHL